MIEQPDTAIAHPDTVMIDSQSALVASVAVLGPRWHDHIAELAVGKLADLWNVRYLLVYLRQTGLNRGRWLKLQEFHVRHTLITW